MNHAQPLPIDWQLPPKPGELRLVPIGGLGEFGMNVLAVHTARSLFLLDCGQLFPSDDQPGIDSVVPDFAYLEPFADRIDAVLLTHGHEDHLGALPYFLERWPVPVYGTAFTLGLLEGKLREHEVHDPKLLRVVADYDRVKIGRGEIEAEWIPVTHSIPDACAIALHTPWGVLVDSGDFKLDPHPIDGRKTGLKRLRALGKAGVRLLMSDSTNILKAGATPSESVCAQGLGAAFDQTRGKLFVSAFSSNVHRIQTLLDLAYEKHRKVCLVGRSLERNVGVARELKRLHLPDDLFIEAREVSLFKPSQVLALCTGTQGEPQSALSRVLRGEVKGLKMLPGDRLVLSSRAIPGNEVPISRMLDAAARLGAETALEGGGPVHATGHGHREDAATMLQALKPETFVPAHGTFRNLQAHARLAQGLGWKPEQTLLLDAGKGLQLWMDGAQRVSEGVPTGKCFVDQGVSHMVDARVVHDRLVMQEDGIVVATLLVDPSTLELAAEPTVLSRGFVVLSDDETYNGLLRGAARKAYEEAPLEIRRDRDLLLELLRQALRRVIRKTTQTRPMVVPMVLDAPEG